VELNEPIEEQVSPEEVPDGGEAALILAARVEGRQHSKNEKYEELPDEQDPDGAHNHYEVLRGEVN